MSLSAPRPTPDLAFEGSDIEEVHLKWLGQAVLLLVVVTREKGINVEPLSASTESGTVFVVGNSRLTIQYEWEVYTEVSLPRYVHTLLLTPVGLTNWDHSETKEGT